MTRVIATIGPAIFDREPLEQVIKAGVSAIRFSASKFSRRKLTDLASLVVEVANDIGCEVELMLDLPGTKTRLCNEEPIILSGSDRLCINYGLAPVQLDRGVTYEVGLTGVDVRALIAVGDILVIGDGEVALLVESAGSDHCVAVPVEGRRLGRRKGVKVEGKTHPWESLSGLDVLALGEFATLPFSSVLVSFVDTPQTIARVRQLLADSFGGPACAPPVPVVAKVETRAGAKQAGAVAQAADAVLLGRGDLLLDTGEVDFHAYCEMVLRATRESGTPIIVGTQLISSLSGNWLPNRSELGYLSRLIEEGVDGLLLAGETTLGPCPVRAVELLTDLIEAYGKHDRGESLCRSR
jgi:pyruvate kinase